MCKAIEVNQRMFKWLWLTDTNIWSARLRCRNGTIQNSTKDINVGMLTFRTQMCKCFKMWGVGCLWSESFVSVLVVRRVSCRLGKEKAGHWGRVLVWVGKIGLSNRKNAASMCLLGGREVGGEHISDTLCKGDSHWCYISGTKDLGGKNLWLKNLNHYRKGR